MILQGHKYDMMSPNKWFVIILGAVALTDAAVITERDTCEYNHLKCPLYHIDHDPSVTEQYEYRHYEPASWIATNETVTEYTHDVSRMMYFRLKKYFNGHNNNSQVMTRTVPVLTMRGNPDDNGFTMYTKYYFLVDSNAPAPRDNKVYRDNSPGFQAYVRMYGGKPTYQQKEHELATLKDAIGDTTLYNNEKSYFAGYNPPWVVDNRRNEVWVEAV